jgi:hypothetical protein
MAGSQNDAGMMDVLLARIAALEERARTLKALSETKQQA